MVIWKHIGKYIAQAYYFLQILAVFSSLKLTFRIRKFEKRAIFCEVLPLSRKKKCNSSFILSQTVISLTKFTEKSINIYDTR